MYSSKFPGPEGKRVGREGAWGQREREGKGEVNL